MTEAVTVIRSSLDDRTILQQIAALTGDTSATVEREILYPYLAFTANCRVPTMFGTRQFRPDILVDAVNGNAATADPYVTKRTGVSAVECLTATVDRFAAARIAERTIGDRVRKKLRIIAPVDVILEFSGTVYRRFSIVGVPGGRIMVDSVTGAMHPLSANAN